MGCDYYQKYVMIQNDLKCFLYHTVNIPTACKIQKINSVKHQHLPNSKIWRHSKREEKKRN